MIKSPERTRTTSTRNVWLAAYYLAHGLTFLKATRLYGQSFRVNFVFEDPDDCAGARADQEIP